MECEIVFFSKLSHKMGRKIYLCVCFRTKKFGRIEEIGSRIMARMNPHDSYRKEIA
jgi:hypothetical protein